MCRQCSRCRDSSGSGGSSIGGRGSGGRGSGSSDAWAYAAKLRLEEATGVLDALLLGRHAQALLGPQPGDLSANPEALARVCQSLALLTQRPPAGVGKEGEGCVWVELVISSCYSEAAVMAVSSCYSEAAAMAASEAAAAMAGSDSCGLAQGSAAAASLQAPALADRNSCVYVIHDTFPLGAF